MRIRPVALLAALLGLGSGPAPLAAQAAPVAPVTEFTVNGLKVLVKQRPSALTVSAGVFFAGDRANLTAANAGIEKLLLDTALEGSEHFPREVLRTELARLAADLGSASNQDYSVVSLQCTREAFDRAFEILADVVMRPGLAEADLARVRGGMITERSSDDDDPDNQLIHLLEAEIYTGHSYALRVQGTGQSLASLGQKEVRAYQLGLMQAARMRLIVVGNVDPADIRRKVKAAFAGLPPGDSPEGGVPPLKFAAPSFQRTAREMRPTYVKGVCAAPAFDGADMPAFRMLMNLLNNRVFLELRRKANLSYAPGASVNLSAAPYGHVFFSTTKVDEAARLCLAEVARLKREPVPESDLKALRSSMRTTLYTSSQTNAAQAGQLAQYELIGGSWRNSLVSSYDTVTPADIQRVAKTWLNNFQFFLLGPAGAEIDEAAFREVPETVKVK
ncbi:MAG: insulinase family protein [Lacunisphaera sp.]|nr:insulinase family protein [Lacunisphaera sp.]